MSINCIEGFANDIQDGLYEWEREFSKDHKILARFVATPVALVDGQIEAVKIFSSAMQNLMLSTIYAVKTPLDFVTVAGSVVNKSADAIKKDQKRKDAVERSYQDVKETVKEGSDRLAESGSLKNTGLTLVKSTSNFVQLAVLPTKVFAQIFRQNWNPQEATSVRHFNYATNIARINGFNI